MKTKIGRCLAAALALSAVIAITGCGGAKGSPSPSQQSVASAVSSATPSASSSPSASPSPSVVEPSWSSLSVSKPVAVDGPWDRAPSIATWHGRSFAIGDVKARTGYEFVVAESTDLAHWTVLVRGAKAPSAYKMLVGHAGLVAVGDEAGTSIWTSTDGVGWTAVTNLPFATVRSTDVAIAAGPKGLVAVAHMYPSDTPSLAWYSADGSSWTSVGSADRLFAGNTVYKVFAGPTGFFATGAMGQRSLYENRAGDWAGWWSSDGLTWQRASIGSATGFSLNSEVHFAASGMVVDQFVFGQWHSADGQSWARTPDSMRLGANANGDPANVTYLDDGDRIVALDCSDSGLAWESFDGSAWKPLNVAGDADALKMLTTSRSPWASIDYAEFTPDGLLLFTSYVTAPPEWEAQTMNVIRIAATP